VLGPEICAHVKMLVLGGATGPKIADAVRNCAEYDEKALPILDCGDFESAVRAAAAAAKDGDVVLMSPASAAFDQFKNFMVRGEFFKKLVREL
jgi:UDP-N-acetylmuramoylalanine--D-glutamate ligase